MISAFTILAPSLFICSSVSIVTVVAVVAVSSSGNSDSDELVLSEAPVV